MISRRVKIAIHSGLLALLLAVQMVGQEPTGSDKCDNFRGNPHPCACGRAMMCGRDGHGSGNPDEYPDGPMKCQKACRKDLCSCLGPCTSRK